MAIKKTPTKDPKTAAKNNLRVFPGRQKKEDPLDKDRMQRLKEWRDEELKDYRVRFVKGSMKLPPYIEVAQALIDCDGYVMKSAIKLGITYSRINKIIKANPKLRDIVQDATEAFLDLAENKLKDKVISGDTSAIIFVLNNKGSRRGWTAGISGEGIEEKPVSFSYELALPPGCTLVGPDGKPLMESSKQNDSTEQKTEETSEQVENQ